MDTPVRLTTSARVAIVGAGAAGLAAAAALARAGYRAVTVLEESDRVGGKCRSFQHEGRTYELGAGALTRNYDNVRELMREHGVKAEPGASGLFVDLETRARTYVPPPFSSGPWWRLGIEGARLYGALRASTRLLAPGFDGLDPELQAPFSEWARARRVEGAAALIEPWFTGFGYGYFDEVPAAYVLKYVALFGFPVYEIMGGGYQGLWERVASRLDVRLSTGVRKVTREGAGAPVEVETDAGPLAFDALVLACPLDRALGFLDATPGERELFSAIRYNDYHAIAAHVERGPDARYGFFSKHHTRSHEGEVVFFYRRFLSSDLTVFYTSPGEGTALGDSVEVVRRTVERLGGRLRSVHSQQAWRYFPHVSPAVMAGGYYERLEAQQGARRTWVTGEICAFTSVESVVAYSRKLVQRFFARPAD